MTQANIVRVLTIVGLALLISDGSPSSAFQEDSIPPGTRITMQNWENYKQFMPDGMLWLFEGEYFWKMPPDVEINVGPRRFAVTARPVLPNDPDYPRLWQIVNKNNQNRYIEYQKRTSRPIPVVVLAPKG